MGARGPAPTRSEERRRTQPPAIPVIKTGPEDMARMPFAIDLSPRPPERDRISENWHPLALELWEALQRSPESMWITSAGWAAARIMCEQLSRELKPQVVGITEGQYVDVDPDDPLSDEKRWEPGGPIFEKVPMKGASLAAIHKLWASFGLIEGDRRRIGHEITLHAATAEMEAAAGNVTSITRDRASLLTPREEATS